MDCSYALLQWQIMLRVLTCYSTDTKKTVGIGSGLAYLCPLHTRMTYLKNLIRLRIYTTEPTCINLSSWASNDKMIRAGPPSITGVTDEVNHAVITNLNSFCRGRPNQYNCCSRTKLIGHSNVSCVLMIWHYPHVSQVQPGSL